MNQDLKGRRFSDVAGVQRESLKALGSNLLKILNNVSSGERGLF
jgi:hypothetical protein